MKRFYRIISAFALLGAFAACQEVEESLGMPELNLSTLELKFGPEVESQQFSFVATRDWSAVPAVDWVSVYPDSGSSSPDPQTVTVTVLANDEYDRSGIVAVDIKMMAMDITVTQSGAKGDPAKLVLYHNDFDKETAADPWPYTDASDVWKNETGSGIDELSYASSKVSVRSNSNSNGSYSNYKDAASGANNLFFAASGYLALEKIALGGNTAIALSFGSERYLYGASDNTFVHSEFPVYVSVDKEKWVPVEYSFPNGDVSGIWDVATARFTVAEGSEYLYIYFAPTIGSAYRLDDLDIKVDVSGEESTTLDFANGIEITYGSSQGGGNDNQGGGDTGDVISATVAQFNAAAESQTQVYELVGTIGGSINTTYGNFDLTDETGTVYVYGLTATNLGYGAKNDKSYASLGLAAGDKIKIRGYRGSFNDKIEVLNAWFIEKVTDQGGGNDQPGGGDTGDVISATVAQFNAAAESQTQVYELVGTIGGSINTTYGNFDLTDETGTVYVYGLTATNLGYGAKNDKSYASLGLAAGDKIKIRGYRGSFNDKIEVLNAWFIEKVTGQGGNDQPGGGNDNPGGGETGGTITLTFPGTNQTAVGSYTATWNTNSGNYAFEVFGFNNNNNGWNLIKCGRKNNASTAYIATKAALPGAYKTISVTYDSYAAANVNSVKLITASDASFSQGVQEVDVTAVSAAGTVNYTVQTPAANKYYKIAYDLAAGSANGFVSISKIEFKTE